MWHKPSMLHHGRRLHYAPDAGELQAPTVHGSTSLFHMPTARSLAAFDLDPDGSSELVASVARGLIVSWPDGDDYFHSLYCWRSSVDVPWTTASDVAPRYFNADGEPDVAVADSNRAELTILGKRPARVSRLGARSCHAPRRRRRTQTETSHPEQWSLAFASSFDRPVISEVGRSHRGLSPSTEVLGRGVSQESLAVFRTEDCYGHPRGEAHFHCERSLVCRPGRSACVIARLLLAPSSGQSSRHRFGLSLGLRLQQSSVRFPSWRATSPRPPTSSSTPGAAGRRTGFAACAIAGNAATRAARMLARARSGRLPGRARHSSREKRPDD